MSGELDIPELRGRVRAFLSDYGSASSWSLPVDSWHLGFDREFSAALAEQGWVGMRIPAEYGGSERGAVERYVVVEELLAAGAPVAAHWVGDRQTAPLLLHIGTDEQRRRYLPLIARAEASFVIGMSEPDAGSDLAAIRTRAEQVDGGWLLNGTKIWTTHADRADFAQVLCRTAEGEDRHAGMSQLLVDLGAPGVSVHPIRTMAGHATFAEVVFEDVHVPAEDLVGEAGNGWKQVMLELSFERAGPERFLSTFPLLEQVVGAVAEPGRAVKCAVGELVAELTALHACGFEIARLQQSGVDPAELGSVCKEAGPRLEADMVERLAAIASLEGLDDPGLTSSIDEARLLARGFTIRGGTTEILRSVIAKGVSTGG